MKKIVLTISFVFMSSVSFSQSGWVMQYTSLTKNIYDIQFVNEMTGYAAADTGTVLKTTNGGTNWFEYRLGISSSVYRLCFLDLNTGYAGSLIYLGASGFSGRLYKTTNGAINWSQISPSNIILPTSIAALNTDTFFVATGSYYDPSSHGNLIRSYNGGINFSASNIISPGIYIENQITSRNAWWCAAYLSSPTRYVLLKSSNSGGAWTELTFNGNNSLNIYGMSFLNDNTGFVYRSTSFMKTINGGTNWISLTVPNCSFLSDVQFINENTGWVTYLNSQNLVTGINRTINGGTNWEYFLINSSNLIQDNMALYFINENTGWICGGYFNGSRGCIMKTTTGGVVTGFSQTNSEIPDNFSLWQNYPNPFNPLTRINYELPITNFVQLKVYDALGNEVETLVNEKQNAGSYSVDFNAASLPSGIYFYKLVTDNFSDVKKMILVK